MQIFNQIQETLGDESIGQSTVYDWYRRFKNNIYSCEDLERTGRPSLNYLISSITMVLEEDPYRSAREIGTLLSVDHKTISRILKEELHMKKINSIWITHILTDKQKQARVHSAEEMLSILNDARYLANIIKGNETFIYYDNPRNSMLLLSVISLHQKKERQLPQKNV